MKRKVVLAFLLTGALVLSGCSKTNNSNETSSGSTSTDSSAQGIDVSNMFSDRDKEIGYDEENSTVIKLSDDSTTCGSDIRKYSDNHRRGNLYSLRNADRWYGDRGCGRYR